MDIRNETYITNDEIGKMLLKQFPKLKSSVIMGADNLVYFASGDNYYTVRNADGTLIGISDITDCFVADEEK